MGWRRKVWHRGSWRSPAWRPAWRLTWQKIVDVVDQGVELDTAGHSVDLCNPKRPAPSSLRILPDASSSPLADGATASLAEPRHRPCCSTRALLSLRQPRPTQPAQEPRWPRPLPGAPAPGLVAIPSGGRHSRQPTGRRSLLPRASVAAALIPCCRCRQWAAQVFFFLFLVKFF